MRPEKTGTDAGAFGDVDRAADRLRLLAGVFEPSLVEFLRRAEITTATRVLDLGCGPGYTTRTLFTLLEPHAFAESGRRAVALGAGAPAWRARAAAGNRHDAQAKDFDPAEMDRLEQDLHALAREKSATTEVVYEMGEMVLERL